MKKTYILLLLSGAILMAKTPGFAATVGNPLDLDIPSRSFILRQDVIDETLDEYEKTVKIKAALDTEIIFDRDLNTRTQLATGQMSGAELEGMWYMLKLGTTFFNRIEPYIKVGTSNLEVKWKQGTEEIVVEADYGFAWGGGIKGIIWEFDDWGIRLTGDAQYRTSEPDVKDVSRGGGDITVSDIGADFRIEEWQAALVLSKKFELPLKWQSIYLVPYTGMTVSDSTVDVEFTDPNAPGTVYSLFDANNDELYGFLMGCDIMSSLKSSFVYSVEARLANEVALTLGGAMKF
ncbi:hypothetical protein ACFL28_00150 [Candidatus Omnitrophota bacterium]